MTRSAEDSWYLWDVASDCLLFSFAELATAAIKIEPTKRNVVSVVSQFYDPLGLVTPVTTRFKVFMQELCEAVADWDWLLTGDTLRRWQSLASELQEGQTIAIPRSLCRHNVIEVASYELWGFYDASVNAYAAVVYLVAKTSVGESLTFITSKARVAPTQTQTIPCLELLSALLLARLLTSVSNGLSPQLDLSTPRCFTDSMVALYWIRGVHKEWKQFVQNRVNEICALVPPNCWSHCRGKDNPADIPSRGLAVIELVTNELWWNGPMWAATLCTDGSDEPVLPVECAQELIARDRLTHNLLTPSSALNVSLREVIACEEYSSLSRLLRVTAYVLRYIRILKS